MIDELEDKFLSASQPANAVAVGEVVTEVTLVPPFAIGNVPVIWVVKPTLPYEGAVATPPDSNTFPVAMSAKFVNAVLELAYIMSPIAYEVVVVRGMFAAAPASGNVYVREAAGAVDEIVVVLVVPSTS